MKKVNLLFLCMIAFISCNEEQDLDLSVNQNDAGKEIVLKERDSRYPLILSQRKTKPRNTKSIPTLSFSDYLGRSFTCSHFPLGDPEDIKIQVINTEKLMRDYPSYFWKNEIGKGEAQSFAYTGFDRYTENSSTTKKINNAGFTLNLGLFSLGAHKTMTEVFTIFKRCNKYIDETMPWALAKDEEKKDRLATVLYNLVEGICIGAVLLKSFMPETTERILAQLNAQDRELEDLKTFGLYPSGNKVTEKPEILFARLDLKEVLAKVAELHPPKAEEPAKEEKEDVIDIEAKPEITFEDFGKLQFQVGKIIKCEEVKKSKKLLCSQVQIGSQVRQIVSGIKAHYSAEEMVGKRVMVVTNLKPAKLAGVLSEGMILCAEDADGNLSLMVPEKEMPAGAEIC